eukprot:COSAG05_NODE_9925_length_593_cov_0.807692_1_plen_60_part_01
MYMYQLLYKLLYQLVQLYMYQLLADQRLTSAGHLLALNGLREKFFLRSDLPLSRHSDCLS